jgi:peptidoglycan/LPS O-acetylase OafA/YrhL
MPVDIALPSSRRDLRLDLFRGLANWVIFLGHIPNTTLAWFTTRNYGFSDGADLFVFISGYTAAFVYARMMLTVARNEGLLIQFSISRYDAPLAFHLVAAVAPARTLWPIPRRSDSASLRKPLEHRNRTGHEAANQFRNAGDTIADDCVNPLL